ncbi:hypothetical protein CK203_024625 [Vitis vinifera]|uniref:Disease resistance protein n=1 Tax=Vitis vinifera TaxID=29760 RepID=A0A438IU88_VITVI|nr:hypothetical protein CK203_024625 [Vitis vinifera]
MNCQKLKSLSPQMCTLLKSLEDLSAVIGPEIESSRRGFANYSISTFKSAGCSKTCAELDGWDLQTLPFLRQIEIGSCYKLKYFPKTGAALLPLCLKISKCPLLRKWCQRDKGKTGPRFLHILCIVFEESDEAGRLRPLDVIL